MLQVTNSLGESLQQIAGMGCAPRREGYLPETRYATDINQDGHPDLVERTVHYFCGNHNHTKVTVNDGNLHSLSELQFGGLGLFTHARLYSDDDRTVRWHRLPDGQDAGAKLGQFIQLTDGREVQMRSVKFERECVQQEFLGGVTHPACESRFWDPLGAWVEVKEQRCGRDVSAEHYMLEVLPPLVGRTIDLNREVRATLECEYGMQECTEDAQPISIDGEVVTDLIRQFEARHGKNLHAFKSALAKQRASVPAEELEVQFVEGRYTNPEASGEVLVQWAKLGRDYNVMVYQAGECAPNVGSWFADRYGLDRNAQTLIANGLEKISPR